MMEILTTIRQSQCEIDSLEMMLLFVLLTVCLLFRTVKIGLVVSYVFVYRWGWVFFRQTFGDSQYGCFLAYAIFGILALILSIARMWYGRAEES